MMAHLALENSWLQHHLAATDTYVQSEERTPAYDAGYRSLNRRAT